MRSWLRLSARVAARRMGLSVSETHHFEFSCGTDDGLCCAQPILRAVSGRFHMPMGYWMVSIDVSNPEGYKAYVAANAEAFHKYGARFLVRGGRYEPLE